MAIVRFLVMYIVAAIEGFAAMNAGHADSGFATVGTREWGSVGDKPVYLYSIANESGMTLEMTNFGAKITSLLVPDRNGEPGDVVLGFDNLQQYIEPNQSIGATIGRYANRIRRAQFEIDGVTYELTANEGAHTLHGGGEFENVVWDATLVENDIGAGVRFRYLSPDGSFGFPGTLDTVVTMLLAPDNAVHIRFEAETDKATYVNLTHHGYFNLNGAADTIHDHLVRIDADTYLVLDDEALATGEIDMLDGKAWDLSSLTRLGDRLSEIPRNGHHHNYVLNKPDGELMMAAEVHDPVSGRTMQVSTTQPGIVFYASMGLHEDITGKYGIRYEPHIAFCIETQHHIDAPNHSHFPSTLLRPGEKYDETVIYHFGVKDDR